MAYCNNCKEEKGNDQKFCNVCGAELAAPAPAESGAAAPQPPPAPAQPVYTAEQFQQHKQEAMNIFSKLSTGLKIAAIGAAASFVCSVVTMIWFMVSVGGMTGPFIWMVISGAAALFFLYLAGTNQKDKLRTIYVAAIISLGSMWVPAVFVMGTIGGYLPGGFSLFATLAALGGVAEAVGGFIELFSAA